MRTDDLMIAYHSSIQFKMDTEFCNIIADNGGIPRLRKISDKKASAPQRSAATPPPRRLRHDAVTNEKSRFFLSLRRFLRVYA